MQYFQTAPSVLSHRVPHSAKPHSWILPQRGIIMANPSGFDDIFDSVAKDFFGSNDDVYKDLLKKGGIEELEKELDALHARGSKDPKDGAALSGAVPQEIRDAADTLAKLDEIMLKTGAAGSAASAGTSSGASSAGTSGGASAVSSFDAEQTAAATAAEQAKKNAEPEKSGMEELNELIGLEDIKKDVKELVSFMKIQKLRAEKGSKSVPVSLHLVFTGNPGTGKTTIARILARLYKEIGVLSKGQLVEVDRSGLVAGYVGQTAVKTQAKIQEALGGILFIDEAYALAKEGNDYGQEAIDTILKAMEDHRDDFVVIVAGYTDLMETFINSNPGLKSRFNKYIEFKDYTQEELYQIFMLSCKKYGYTLTEEADKALRAIILHKVLYKDENFANAREMRNLFEAVVTNQATRISEQEDVSDELLNTLEKADFEDYLPPAVINQ
ncbi:MAG: AAA family ATPase [Lachnospiraceae bacterium]|nr:AAA family ATPase [Lachnospiraceae bacterium]